MITNDLKRIDSKLYRFDQTAADYAVRFFSYLHHYRGEWAGQPFVLQDWQQYVVSQLFGWKHIDSGLRMYRKAFLEIPKKNGKSSLAAGLALLLAFGDGEPGAAVYCLANDREQAHIVFDAAKIMAETSPVLGSCIEAFQTSIVQKDTQSVLRSLSSDVRTKAGFDVSGAVIDEYYAFPDSELVDLIEMGIGARRQPLIIKLTTAGNDQESPCFREYEYAKNVTSGAMDDPTFFTVIYEAEGCDDWTNPETWRKANPSLGVTIPESYLASECETAKNVPAKQNAFKRWYLNLWTQQSVRWLDMAAYDACVVKKDYTFKTEGRQGFIGLDLAKTIDLVGVCEVWAPDPLDPNGKWDVVPKAFIPADNILQRGHTDHVPYDLWTAQKYIIATTGNVVDYDYIMTYLDQRREITKCNDLVGDPWNFTMLSTTLQKGGYNVIEARQGYKTLSPCIKELQRLILSGKINFPSDPVLRWNFDNVSIVEDEAGNEKPVKRNNASHIDLVIAILCALHGHLETAPEQPATPGIFVYEG